MAEGGTLFLDELNSLSIDMQPKLLRYLQDRTYWRLGGNKENSSNVRVIAAVNEAPMRLVKEGRLREDLFYRLCVGFITIPSLSERKEDISLLAEYFIEKYQPSLNHTITGIAPQTKELLESMSWDGNVRMLENTIIRSLIFQDMPGLLQPSSINTIDISLPHDNVVSAEPTPPMPALEVAIAPEAASSNTPVNLDEAVKFYERNIIVRALNRNRGCLSKAARELGVHRSTLQYKVERHKIETLNF